MNKIEFKNGSYIMGVDLANDSKIVRGNRSKIIMVDSEYMKQENRKWIREQIKAMKLKWHQNLRIELDFLWEDIKDWAFWYSYKIRAINKGE